MGGKKWLGKLTVKRKQCEMSIMSVGTLNKMWKKMALHTVLKSQSSISKIVCMYLFMVPYTPLGTINQLSIGYIVLFNKPMFVWKYLSLTNRLHIVKGLALLSLPPPAQVKCHIDVNTSAGTLVLHYWLSGSSALSDPHTLLLFSYTSHLVQRGHSHISFIQ